MAERTVVMDKVELNDEQAQAVKAATDRAEKAEAELAKLKAGAGHPAHEAGTGAASGDADAELKTPPSPSTAGEVTGEGDGEAELRKDSMMAHLLDSLDEGKDIGHYGRLVFAMVARHFMPHEEVMAWMMKDKDVDEEKAKLMLAQVEGKDYSPPKRAKILEYQAEQEFPILPDPKDPDCGNLYKSLKFPDEVYEHIGKYQEAKSS